MAATAELFGDGRIVCLPTYGHTPGHQSLKVRLDESLVRELRELLGAEQQAWLRDAVRRLYPGHDWVGRMA